MSFYFFFLIKMQIRGKYRKQNLYLNFLMGYFESLRDKECSLPLFFSFSFYYFGKLYVILSHFECFFATKKMNVLWCFSVWKMNNNFFFNYTFGKK